MSISFFQGDAAKDQNNLDLMLRTLVAMHGYAAVQDHLHALGSATADDQRAQREREANPRYLLTLPTEQRERILTAAVDAALPLYLADMAKPEAERELTRDLETGDFYEYDDAGDQGAEARHA